MGRSVVRSEDEGRLLLRDALLAARALLVARLRQVESVSPPARQADVDEEEVGAESKTLQVCEIASWRGYVMWQFYVWSDSRLETPFSSPYFRAGGHGTPERTAAALRAHAALVEKLLAAGWEQDGRGAEWFSVRFRR